jgi:putative peptidoglycan lipid II flippase
LRIPVVRLVYGTKIFDWEATVQTGMVLSVYALGITFQTLMSIISRSFFALHDTKTPVKISFIGLGLLIFGDIILVKVFNLPVWALAASFSFSVFVESIILIILLNKKIGEIINSDFISHSIKILAATIGSGMSMYLLLKIFDRSVWIKRLSFLSGLDVIDNFPFQKFVLDTRYTTNLLILTIIVFAIGMAVYILLSLILRIPEAKYFLGVFKKIILKKVIPSIPTREQEPVSPTTTDTQEQ